MPTVPLIEGPQVRVQGLPGQRLGGQANFSAPRAVVPDTTGAFDSVTRAAIGLAQQQKERADKVALIDAQTKVDAWQQENIYGAQGALMQQGQNAFGGADKYGQMFDEHVMKVGSSLSTPEQQLAFKQAMAQRRSSQGLLLLRHERGEMNVYAKEKRDAALTASVQTAVMNAHDPSLVSMELAKMNDIADANVTGAPAEVVAQQKMLNSTRIYTGVIENLVDTNPQMAQQYFEKNKDQIDPTLHDEIRDKLEIGTVKQQALVAADKIISDNPGDYEAQVAAAREEKDQKARDSILARIDANYIREQRNKKTKEENLDNTLGEQLQNNVAWEDLPVNIQLAGQSKKKTYIEAYNRANGLEKYDDDKADTFYDEVRTLYDFNPETIRDVPMMQIMKMPAGTKRDELLELRRDVIDGKDPVESTDSEFNEVIQLYTYNTLTSAKPSTPKGKKIERDFRNAMRAAYNQYKAKNDGRKPTYDELIKMADRQISYVSGDDIRRFEYTLEEVDLSGRERDAIIWAMRQTNPSMRLDDITDDLINLNAYRYVQNGGTLDKLVEDYRNATR